MTKKILVIGSIHESGLNILKDRSDYSYEVIDDVDNDLIKNKIKDCDGVTLRVSQFTDEIFSHANKLQIISRHGVGYDNIDLDVAKKNNISIAITATANAVAVAEHVLFMLFSIAKRNNMYNDCVKSGNFSKRVQLPNTIELWNKNILIAGFGRIGQSLIKKCLGLEMNVFVYDPYISKDIIENFGGNKVEDLINSVSKMDAISLHMPMSKKTKHIINYELLKKMKKNCIIINAARGGIIEENDLNRALDENLIFGAGLDVFEEEPPSEKNLLLKNSKTLLSPHSATFTEECLIRMGKETVQNILDFFDDKLDESKKINL